MGETRIVIWVTDHMVVISSSCLPAFLSNLGMALLDFDFLNVSLLTPWQGH